MLAGFAYEVRHAGPEQCGAFRSHEAIGGREVAHRCEQKGDEQGQGGAHGQFGRVSLPKRIERRPDFSVPLSQTARNSPGAISMSVG